MTLFYRDPEALANIPLKSRTVLSEQVPGHDVISLPGTVEADIGNTASRLSTIVTALGSYLSTLAGAVTAGRIAVDLTTAVTTYISTIATAIGSAAAQEHTTAASPHSVRLSTGSAFYDGAKTGQLPTGLGQLSTANSLSIVHATGDTLISDSSTTASMSNGSSISGNTAGKSSAGFTLLGGGSLVGTLVVEVALGGWESTYFIDPFTGAQSSSLVVSSPVSDVFRGIFVPPGASQVRVKVSAWTSGTSSAYLGFSNANPTLGLLSTLSTGTTVIEQKTSIGTGADVQFTSATLKKGGTIRNCSTGAQTIYVWTAATPTATNSWLLAPGECTPFLECTNPNVFFLRASASGGAAAFAGS